MTPIQKIVALTFITAPLLLNACKSDNTPDPTPDDPNDTFGATLTGANEVPPVSTSATGTYNAVYNRTTKVLSYTVSYQGLTPTMGHIHSVTATTAAGNTGGITVPFGGTLTSPITGSTTLTEAQMTDMYAKKTYVNLHTAQNPTGEIRGNIEQTD